MAERATMPEPPDGHALLWLPRDSDESPVLIWRNDQLAEDLGDRDARWHTPNTAGASTTWAEAVRIAEADECPMSEAVVLAPAPERIGDHLREAAGWCREHGVQHNPEEWARAERAVAEGGGSGG